MQGGGPSGLRRLPRRRAAGREARQQERQRDRDRERERQARQRLQRRNRRQQAQAGHAEGAAQEGRPFKAYSWLQVRLSLLACWVCVAAGDLGRRLAGVLHATCFGHV
jgi:Flp pilus assembly protein TadB